VRPFGVESASETSRIDLQKVLASKKFVDLTYGFAPGIPAVVWFSRRTTQDEKQAGLPLLPEDQNVLNAMLAKTVGVWMRPSAVVENMLGQLTESRGRNEDRL